MEEWIKKNPILFFVTIIFILTTLLIPFILVPSYFKIWTILYALSSILLTFAFARTIKESLTKKSDYIRLFGLIIINIAIIMFTFSIYTMPTTINPGDPGASIFATFFELGAIGTLGTWIICLTELITKGNLRKKVILLIITIFWLYFCFSIIGMFIGVLFSIFYISAFLIVWGSLKQAELNENEKLTNEQ